MRSPGLRVCSPKLFNHWIESRHLRSNFKPNVFEAITSGFSIFCLLTLVSSLFSLQSILGLALTLFVDFSSINTKNRLADVEHWNVSVSFAHVRNCVLLYRYLRHIPSILVHSDDLVTPSFDQKLMFISADVLFVGFASHNVRRTAAKVFRLVPDYHLALCTRTITLGRNFIEKHLDDQPRNRKRIW